MPCCSSGALGPTKKRENCSTFGPALCSVTSASRSGSGCAFAAKSLNSEFRFWEKFLLFSFSIISPSVILFWRYTALGRAYCSLRGIRPHLIIHFVFTAADESQPLVKMHGAIGLEHLQRQGYGRAPRFRDQFAHERGADAATAMLGQQSNINEVELLRAAQHNHASHRLLIAENHRVLGARVSRLIPSLLRVELHAQKGFLLGLVPSETRDLCHARAGIEAVDKIFVLGGERGQAQVHRKLIVNVVHPRV